MLNPFKKRVKPPVDEEARALRLAKLSESIAKKRTDAIDARKNSGIEEIWIAAEEAYLGIDEFNRHEFKNAKWAKPTSMSGPLQREQSPADKLRSSVFVRLTARYVDAGTSKLCEIALPIDDKAFSMEATPRPDLVKAAKIAAPAPQPAPQPQAPGQPPAPMQQGQPPAAPDPQAQAKAQLQQASDAAEKGETRIYDWMVDSKYPAEMRKVVHDAGRIGVGVLKGPFPDVQTNRALTKNRDGSVTLEIEEKIYPASAWRDPWNIFPTDDCGEDAQECEGIFERDFLTKAKLKALRNKKNADGEYVYLRDAIDQVLEEGPGKSDITNANPSEKNVDKRFAIWYYTGTLSPADMQAAKAVGAEDLLDQDDIPAIVTMVNDTVIRAVPNPLKSGKHSYRVMSWSRRAGHWAGVGIAEQIKVPQAIVNGATRALLNNAGYSQGPQIIIDQLGMVPADKDMTLTPGKFWYRTEDSTNTDVRQMFNIVDIPNVGKELQAVIDYGMKLAEESTNIPLITQGQGGDTVPQTFGGMELQNENSHTWLRDIAYRLDDAITEPLVNAYYEWLLLDPEVPDEEKGDFKINAHGSIAMVERAIQEKVLTSLLPVAESPAYEINQKKLMAEIVKGKRIDPSRIQFSEDEIAKRSAQPPAPPLPIQVEQLKGQNAIQAIQAKTQADMQAAQAEMQHEQGLLQNGGAQPHQASAIARIEQEKIRASTAQSVEGLRAQAEMARAQKEQEIAQQNGQFKLQELQVQREIAILEYANKRELNLDQVKSQLAQAAMDNQTKQQLASAEIELAREQGGQDRAVDLHKHTTSLIRDEINTPMTP